MIKKIILISILITFLLPILTQAAVYSDDEEALIHIDIIGPRPGYTKEKITQLAFITDSDSQCLIYSNYPGTWKALSGTLWVEADIAYRYYTNLTTPGNYTWNVVCKTVGGDNETWALYEAREFRIIPPEPEPEPEINITENKTINLTEEININITINESVINITGNETVEINKSQQIINNCTGCMSDENCLEIGFLEESINGMKYYCSSNHIFEIQNSNRIECSENFECKSNYCLNNICRSDNIITKLFLILNFY